ncbi:hypothetical protein GCM10023189_25680 [Nibrella saemangeumensis]|uniref:WD40-like Beta Propeller Repeat n=1 Tax=Nibrella saemangeumensis TaxID=1084526 RepID=A0ABP8MXE7_9BACT
MYSLLKLLFAIKVAFCSCQPEIRKSGFQRGRPLYQVTRTGRLPRVVNESSGLAYRAGHGTFWTHNDSGGKPTLYEVAADGRLVDTLSLPGLTNTDWEDLAQQDSTVLFVGDIGNNQQTRRKLTIYRVDRSRPATTDQIVYHYADQSAFPPPPSQHYFDCEAMLYSDNRLYLFSKNRPLASHYVKQYSLPARAGDYALLPTDSVYIRAMVTGADISPDGHLFALLTYGKVLLFAVEKNQVNFRRPLHCIRLPRGQTEAISFVSPTDFVITNEKGKMFLVSRK